LGFDFTSESRDRLLFSLKEKVGMEFCIFLQGAVGMGKLTGGKLGGKRRKK